MYSRKLSNGEFIDRQWLVYSVSSDRVYCFCCKLFPSHATNLRISSLATVGLRDWKHIFERLKTHEISQAHIKSAMIGLTGAERTFSKLKLIKTYLRSTMSQQRLTGLAKICIEKELSEQLNYDFIINDFASKKARKIKEF